MKVIPFIYDSYDDLISNTYILIDEDNQCVVIDPGCGNDGIVKYIKKNNLALKAILLTHGHFDHMRGVDILEREYNVPLYIGFFDLENLKDEHLNCSEYFSDGHIKLSTPGIGVSEGETIDVLKEKIVVIETPFHTAGSVCYYLKDSGLLFSGDSLFKDSIGRTDLPGSKPKEVYNSLSKLAKLDDGVKVYPGHGPFTTIKNERLSNPFVKI